jgi:hypothetical protein
MADDWAVASEKPAPNAPPPGAWEVASEKPANPDDTGIWASVKRNTAGMASAVYHAFNDPATDEELQHFSDTADKAVKKFGVSPEYMAKVKTPGPAALAYHRLVEAPGEDLNEKAGRELSQGDKLSAWTDKALAHVPMLGPFINSVAERTEKGDYSGALTDIAMADLASRAPEVMGKVGEVAGKGREAIGGAIHTPEGDLTSGAKLTGKVAGGSLGAAAGSAVGHEYLGAVAGYKLGPSLMERLFPEPKTVAEARERAEAYQAKAEDLMRRGKEQDALDRKASATQRLKDKLAAQATQAAAKAKEIDPDTAVFPEPRNPMPGDKPGAMWSVGREDVLPQAAQRGAPGAGDVLRNTGKPIIYTPKEGVGYPGPRKLSDLSGGFAKEAPAAIELVLKETGWEYGGKNSMGIHEFKQPGTNISISVLDKDMNPATIRAKIAAKLKEF